MFATQKADTSQDERIAGHKADIVKVEAAKSSFVVARTQNFPTLFRSIEEEAAKGRAVDFTTMEGYESITKVYEEAQAGGEVGEMIIEDMIAQVDMLKRYSEAVMSSAKSGNE